MTVLIVQLLLVIAAVCVLVIDQFLREFDAMKTAAALLIVGLLIVPGITALH